MLSRILWHAFVSSRVDRLPREELLKKQREKLQQAIAHGYSKTKFWRNWLDQSGVRPDDIMEIEEFFINISSGMIDFIDLKKNVIVRRAIWVRQR